MRTSASAPASDALARRRQREHRLHGVARREVQGSSSGGKLRPAHGAGEQEWTIIFSKNSTSWGSFFYDPARTRCASPPSPRRRVPRVADLRLHRPPARQATVALDVGGPAGAVHDRGPQLPDLYIESLRNELRNEPGLRLAGLETGGAVLPAAEPQPRGGPDLGERREMARPAWASGQFHDSVDQGPDPRSS